MMKRAIVIGASSGIGKEVAQNLINEGWTVGLAARRDGLMLSMMHATPDRVKVAKIDVNASNAADELNKLIKRIGGMDLFSTLQVLASRTGSWLRSLSWLPSVRMPLVLRG